MPGSENKGLDPDSIVKKLDIFLLYLLQVFFLMLLLCLTEPSETASLCPTTHYTIVSKAGRFIACWECPPCFKGTGLTKQCGTVLENGTEIDCKPCQNGTFNDNELPTVTTCQSCHTCESGRETLRLCTPNQNRKCGKCQIGFYPEVTAANDCHRCSCCNDTSHQEDTWVKKCAADGLPANMQCRKTNQGCKAVQITETTSIKHTVTPPVTTTGKAHSPSSLTPSIQGEVINKQEKAANNGTHISIRIETVIAVLAGITMFVIILVISLYCFNQCKKGTQIADTELGNSLYIESNFSLFITI